MQAFGVFGEARYGEFAYVGQSQSAVATAIAITPPAELRTLVGVASASFTVTVNAPPSGGPVTVTPSDGGGGGTFTPSSVVVSDVALSATFTYTPLARGLKSITITNTGGLANPSAVSYKADTTAYYFSAAGNDSTGDGSTAAPWRTWAAVTTWGLVRGAVYSFNGGDTFSGQIIVSDGEDGSDPTRLIELRSYGTGKAIISFGSTGGSSPVIDAAGTGGILIDGLEVVGSGSTLNASGQHLISFDPPPGSTGDRYNITVQNCKIHDGKRGVSDYEYRSWQSPPSVFTTQRHHNVRILNNEIYAVWDEGISVRRRRVMVDIASDYITDLLIKDNHIHDLGGNTETGGITSAIVVAAAQGVVERNLLHDIGVGSWNGCGAIFWCQVCELTVQYNEIYNAFNPGGDAGGIDLDTGTFNTVVQFNYVHDCEGSGLLCYQPQPEGTPSAIPWQNNVFRYNVVQNCGTQPHPFGGGKYWGSIGFVGQTFGNVKFYGNTVIAPANATGALIRHQSFNWTFDTGAVSSVEFYNNVFYALGTIQLIDFPAGSGTAAGHVFSNNAFYASGAAVEINWFGTTYTSVSAWAAAVATADDAAVTADPLLSAPATEVIFNDPYLIETLTVVTPAGGSPLRNAGLDLKGVPYSFTPTTDYAGRLLPASGAMDIGAIDADAGLAAVTLTTEAFRNYAGTLLAGATIQNVLVHRISDRAPVLSLSNLVTNATTGVLVLTDAALVGGTAYMVTAFNADGTVRGAQRVVAA